MFKGSIPALITPFKNGEIDWPAFENFIEWQIEQGSHGLVPCGTTGESPTLTHEEHNQVIERCIAVAAGRVPVIAGTGSNSTREAIELTRHAKEAGADAALIITPYYNKPSQEGMYQHYKAINDAVDIPIILYNVPGRCVVDMSVETVARLAKLPNIAGIKDATADLSRPAATRALTGDDFCQLSGEDDSVIEFLKQGGVGVISVVANLAPKESAAVHNAWMEGAHEKAEKLFDKLRPLADALFCETSPGPAKYGASKLGLCQNELRLPMIPATEAAQAKMDAAIAHAGLLDGNAGAAKAHG
ncbi:MAG: 4-hydroxy-tetrahydrodipicolinate synthase [Alphaproteobacteria bacterium]|nr:4-hydroxy-tetrahydrodipicolinate synthase [Alphaproteobacteria bacterium]